MIGTDDDGTSAQEPVSSAASMNYSELSSIYSESNILYETTVDNFYNETDFFINSSFKISNDTQYNETINLSEVKPYNVTVFSGYPQELLCFGAISFIVFAIVGVLGNLISILALSNCKRLRNATTAFIVNLCVADLIFCSFSMPLSALMFIEKTWFLGDTLCKLFPLIRYSNGAVSVFSVIAITVNRYVLVVHPKIYPVLYTKLKMAIMIVLIWLVSLLLLLLPLLEIWGTLGYDPKVGTCSILQLKGKSPKMFLYITAFVLPSILFVACYMRIFFVVRKASKKASGKRIDMNSGRISFTVKRIWLTKSFRHSEMRPIDGQPRDRNKELRILRLMLVIFVLFLVCYFPVSFVKIFRKEDDLPILNVLGYLGIYFSNVINPIIYIVMSKEYRSAYKEFFCQAKVKRQTMMDKL